MKCDMCGSEGKLYQTTIEDAQLRVCHECSKFGKVTGIIEQSQENTVMESPQQTEVMEILVDGFANMIKKKREDLGLKQEQFAQKISEKTSLVQKIESGHLEPSLVLAKKIGRFLKIKLTEEHQETPEKQATTKTKSFTIGDFIKIKGK